MDEAAVRLSVVAGVLAAALLTVALLKTRAQGRPEKVNPGDLAPGWYLLASATCLACAPARRALAEALGTGGFTEINWEHDPETFHDLGITAVPATLIVGGSGDADLYLGQPDKALRRLGP
jgi:hypothetical protein